MNKIKAWISNNKRTIILEVILTILLIFMLDTILASRSSFSVESDFLELDKGLILIDNNNTFEQTVLCKKDRIKALRVSVNPYMFEDPFELNIDVFDESGEILSHTCYEIKDIKEIETLYIKLDQKIENVKKQKLKIIYSGSGAEGCSVSLLTGKADSTICNPEKNIHMQLVYYSIDSEKYYCYSMAVFIILWIVLSMSVLKLLYRAKVEYVFLLLYLSLGILFSCVIPINGVPDEHAHIKRAYGISKGDIFAYTTEDQKAAGSMMSATLSKGTDVKLTDIIDESEILSDNEIFTPYPTSALFSPLSYAPQAIGMFIGDIITDNFNVLIYFARFVTFLSIGAILFFSVKYVPIGKNILCAIALMPMNMHQCISMSADGFAFAIVVAFISYVLYMCIEQKDKMNYKQLALLYILLVFLASCKIVYVPLCLLAFAIPKSCFGSKEKYIKHAIIAASMVLLLVVGWLLISSNYLIEFNDGVDTPKQIMNILKNPIDYMKVLFNSFIVNGEFYFDTLFGKSLGSLNIQCNFVLFVMGVVGFVYVAVTEKIAINSKEYEFMRKLLIFGWVIVCLLIFTSIYVQWTPVGNEVVNGVQGRYFIPVLFPFVISLKRGIVSEDIYKEEEYKHYLVYLIYLFINLSAVTTLFSYNII